MRLRWRQLIGILIGAVITPFAVGTAIASAGAGHGTYLLAKLLFPYSMLLTRFTGDSITNPLIGIAFVQFPIYGLVLTSPASRRALKQVVAVLVLLHSFCVLLCLAGLLPNFS
ncbi:MAG: hypothetical protein H7A20_10450 [Rhodanobacteraceae bacterium]|nr:hypothetical protein [Xanthomonadales bacterium]MCP5479183.1 hypothetical protein [Rhodanobacteraceae bacterium]HPF73104.1 hypothetical protein [Xanthomonadaceae bacterium]HRX99656.1 hypothetical protein [Xanthomonadaceae bacterium]